MDFFEHQELARKTSRKLVLHFSVAVLLIVAAVNLVALAVWTLSTATEFSNLRELFALWQQSPLSWQVPVSTIAFIAVISFSSWLGLREGGAAVAKMMGAKAIASNSSTHQRLINTVTEMAIASGTPVPEIYVMEREHSINAFAAGYSPNEAIVCVTQGLLDNLTRDELQAVIGHEFSHILNGDIRLNIKLLSVLSGIVALGQLGYWLMDSSRSRSRYGVMHQQAAAAKHGASIYLGLVGFCLWIVGSIGVFFSRLIKSAVSRQREYLADASSVQFTRNAISLASALEKIDNHQMAGRLNNRHAEDLSHMCFASPLAANEHTKKSFASTAKAASSSGLRSLFATHPSIFERINKIAPNYLLQSKAQKASQAKAQLSLNEPAASQSNAANPSVMTQSEPQAVSHDIAEHNGTEAALDAPLPAIDYEPVTTQSQQSNLIEQALSHMASPSTEALAHATSVLSQLPDGLIMSLREKDFIEAVILGLIINATGHGDTALNSDLLQASVETKDKKVTPSFQLPLIKSYFNEFAKIDALPVYPILEIAIPTLKQLPKPQKANLLKVMSGIIQQDNKISPDELFIYLVVFRHLNPKASRKPGVRYHSYNAVTNELSLLFSYLIQLTLNDQDNTCADTHAKQQSQIDSHFKQVMTGFSNRTKLIPLNHISSNQLASAILRLEYLPPLLKKPLLPACYDLMMWNENINHQENDWIRMLADCWDCPLPPLR